MAHVAFVCGLATFERIGHELVDREHALPCSDMRHGVHACARTCVRTRLLAREAKGEALRAGSGPSQPLKKKEVSAGLNCRHRTRAPSMFVRF